MGTGFFPSKLMGAVVVLGLGIVLIALGRIFAGLEFTGVAIFFLLIALSEEVGWKAFWFATAALIFAGLLTSQAIMGTVRGQTTYTAFGIRERSQLVTRESSPEKFRSAIKARWELAGFGLLGAAGAFAFYLACRKAEYE
jgi:hypothetical protein